MERIDLGGDTAIGRVVKAVRSEGTKMSEREADLKKKGLWSVLRIRSGETRSETQKQRLPLRRRKLGSWERKWRGWIVLERRGKE